MTVVEMFRMQRESAMGSEVRDFLRNDSAVPCTAQHITWAPCGAQCLNCGGTGPNCYSVKHIKAVR